MNIFERATRKKLRFPSVKGELTAEQLFDLPLIAKSPTRDVKLDLDTIAREVNRYLKEFGEGSFVEVSPDPRKADMELRLEILKQVIASKQKDQQAAETRAANAEKRRKLLDALAAKEGEELSGMSKEDILKELESLDA